MWALTYEPDKPGERERAIGRGDGSCRSIGMTDLVTDDLAWVRDELCALAHQRRAGPFTDADQARYDGLCQQERELLAQRQTQMDQSA
jgi:hypothetical protein